MLPKIIMYNSVSVDGAVKDFAVDVALHYEVASKYNADAFLVGSITAKTGIEMFNESEPDQDSAANSQRESNATGPYWIIADGAKAYFRENCIIFGSLVTVKTL